MAYRDDAIEQIIELADSHYIAEDGLMMLHVTDIAKPTAPFSKWTASGDNAILFLAVWIYLLRRIGRHEKYRDRVFTLLTELQWGGERGMFGSNPGRRNRLTSHDNLVGVAALSFLYGFDFHYDIVRVGYQTGFRFQKEAINVQPKDIAFFCMLCGYTPTYFELFNIVISFVVGCFLKVEHSSPHQVTWLRKEALYVAEERFKELKKYNYWVYPLTCMFARLYSVVMDKKYGGLVGLFKVYYRNHSHPIVELSIELGIIGCGIF